MGHKTLADTWPGVLEHVHEWGPWSYLVLAALVILEGPVATLLAASAASLGLMRPILVFITAAGANLTSDAFWYQLGRMGKTNWIVNHVRWLGLRQDRIEMMQRKVRQNGVKMLFIAKLTLVFSVPALVAAGMSRVSFRTWLPYGILAETLWSGMLVAVGFFLSQYIARLEKGFQIAAIAGTVLLLPTVLVLLIRYGSQRGIQPE